MSIGIDPWSEWQAEMALWKRHIYVVQKVIGEKEVSSHLNKGWSVKACISPASVIIEKPLDMQKVLLGFQKVIEEAKKQMLSE
ncbi:MAG: hypothetical protein KGI33_08980 [Thaumarchaeota archaeon]|nr:hypothetical protein [Nitrososphaerota archaeon]